MPRSFAASLSALAMAIVVLRGAARGEPIEVVTAEAMVAMFVFAVMGYVAGQIADYLVRDSLERSFRTRMDWYREGLTELGLETVETPDEDAGQVTGDRRSGRE